MASTSRLGLSMFVALITVVALTGPPAHAAIVYDNDFQTAFGSEWSSTAGPPTIIGAPAAPPRQFLGEFTNGTLSLTLPSLPAHTIATVEFDLFVLRSWDGLNQNFGCNAASCESWGVGVREGHTLTETNFNNIGGFPGAGAVQAWPDRLGGKVHPFHTGAIEHGTLGFTALIQDAETDEIEVVCCFDAVYHISLTFPHHDPLLTLDFTARDLQSLDPALQQEHQFFFPDESWGLDNVRVEVAVPETATIALLGTALVLTGIGALARRRRRPA